MPEDEEAVVCHILHTAEFARDTLEALTAAIQKDIKPALADNVCCDPSAHEFLVKSLN